MNVAVPGPSFFSESDHEDVKEFISALIGNGKEHEFWIAAFFFNNHINDKELFSNSE